MSHDSDPRLLGYSGSANQMRGQFAVLYWVRVVGLIGMSKKIKNKKERLQDSNLCARRHRIDDVVCGLSVDLVLNGKHDGD